MHELTITQHLLAIALDAAQGRRLKTIRLCYGPYAGIDPACVAMYLTLLAKGTDAEGVKLQAVRVPLRIRCGSCGKESEVQRARITCPACGGGDVTVVSGREFYVDTVEVEDDGNQGAPSGDGVE